MRKTKGLLLSLLLISLTIAPAYAMRHDGEGTGQFEKLKQELDLTSQQETDIKGIFADSREETKTLRDETKANRESIRNIFDAEVLDEPSLRELAQKQAELQADMMVAKHATRARINQVLTPEQQEKHKELRNKRKGLQRRTGQGKTAR